MSHLRREIPPPDLLGILLESDACPEKVDGRLDVKEQAMEKKGHHKVP